MSRWALPASFLALLLALAAIAPASANPPCGVGSHPDCATPTPSDPEMAVTAMTGFETNNPSGNTDGLVLVGTSSIATNQARTGTYSLRVNPASGASGYGGSPDSGYEHFGLWITTLPSVARTIAGQTATNTGNLLLNTNGTIAVRNNTTVIGTSTTALSTGQWYWIGWRNASSVTGVLLQIDSTDQVSGTSASGVDLTLGCRGTEASAIDLNYDDVIADGAGFLLPSRVNAAFPISDSSRVDWTNDAAGTTNLFDAINNKPPVGIADTTGSTGLHQIRDATNGTDTYVANMTTYATLGIVATDKVLAVETVIVTGAPSGTSPKAGSLTTSNPTITKASFGNFYEGSTIAGTYPSGWVTHFAVTASPTVTIANSPVITITQDTSSTRIAMVCALYLYVAWTPGALGHITNVNQAVARAGNY